MRKGVLVLLVLLWSGLASLVTAQEDTAGRAATGTNEVRALLDNIDTMIADQDRRLADLVAQIDAATDPVRQARLAETAYQWTAALDELERLRSTIEQLINEIEAPSQDGEQSK